MKLYNVYYHQEGEKFWFCRHWAASEEAAIEQARDMAGNLPSGKPGPNRNSHFSATEAA